MQNRRDARAVSVVLLGGLLLPSLAGCGTIFGGSTEVITFQSSPSAASVATSPPTATYTTPASVSLQRKQNYLLTFSADGYSSAEFQIRREMRVGILVADVLLTGLIGVVVDAVTGGWWKLEPKTAVVTLERASAANEGLFDGDKIEVAVSVHETEEGREVRLQASAPVVVQVEPRQVPR